MTPASRNLILRILAILIIVAVAGPEMGLGLEAFAVLSSEGVNESVVYDDGEQCREGSHQDGS